MDTGTQRRQVARRGVRLRLGGVPRPRNHHADGGKIQAPAECELRHRETGREQRAELFREGDAVLEAEAREGFADVELLAVAVVRAVVRRGERGLRSVLPREQPRGERQADDDRHALLLGLVQDRCDRRLAVDVEDDLQTREPRLSQGRFRFRGRFHARAEALDLAFRLQLAERLEHLAPLEFFQRDAVQLGQIQGLNFEPLQRVFGVPADVRGPAVLHQPRIGPAAELGGDEVVPRPFALEAGDELFAASRPVNVRGIQKRGPRIDRGVQRGERVVVRNVPPLIPADLPAPEADIRHLHRVAAEGMSSHGELRRGARRRAILAE